MATRRTAQPRAPRETEPFQWTRSHLARLPQDGNRYEVLNGELLVTPQAGLPHQWLSFRLGAILDPYCNEHRLGVIVAPGAVVFDENELQPDVQVIPISESEARTGDWESIPTARLVVEVISPGSDRIDRGKKRVAYLARGIPEYWVIDLEARHVEVFMPGADEPRIVTDALEWRPLPAVQPLRIDLASLLGG